MFDETLWVWFGAGGQSELNSKCQLAALLWGNSVVCMVMGGSALCLVG